MPPRKHTTKQPKVSAEEQVKDKDTTKDKMSTEVPPTLPPVPVKPPPRIRKKHIVPPPTVVESEPEETEPPVSVRLHIHTFVGKDKTFKLTDDDSETGEDDLHLGDDTTDDPDESQSDEPPPPPPSKQSKRKREAPPPIPLSRQEMAYYKDATQSKRRKMTDDMAEIANTAPVNPTPYKFRILELPIPLTTKTIILQKINSLNEICDDSEEKYKLKGWLDGFFNIPFPKYVPLPVTLDSGALACSNFLRESQAILDDAVYGMKPVKTQIMQILAQFISNPSSAGNVIALKGAMGVGKTSIAKNGIAKALRRPFEFHSLGGASDSSTMVGHSYTYIGSTWGSIANTLIKHQCMNPVIYFDELDKLSDSSKGEEIAGVLIHLTDRSQNMGFHDKYFAGIDIDLSRCLFVFSFNDEHKVHPILRDRMQVIHCDGYTADDKKQIVIQHAFPLILKHINMVGQLTLEDEALKYLIREYSTKEEGVRTLIRILETLVTRINLMRIAGDDLAKDYSFYYKFSLPCVIREDMVRHILKDTIKNPDVSISHMYC